MAILKSLIVNGVARVIGDLTAAKIIKQGGVSSQFLKADGSVDSNAYIVQTSTSRPGVTKLYRRDVNDGYNVQTLWDGTYWILQGYYEDTYHAPCRVSYADNADTVDGYHASAFAAAGHTHNLGNKSASDLSSTYPSGISVGGIYNNGYPFTFGCTITACGNGGYFQIAGEWNSAVTGASNYDFPTEMYIRGRRDSYDVWTTWSRVLTDRNYNTYSPSLNGVGASGTWGINITGNANYATSAGSATFANALQIKSSGIHANERGSAPHTDALYTGGWASSSLGYATTYGTYIDLSGYSTWYHRLAFNTNGVIEHFMGINTTTLSKVGNLAYTSDIPTSLPANGGNADTVDNKHASDFMPASGSYIGGTTVADVKVNLLNYFRNKSATTNAYTQSTVVKNFGNDSYTVQNSSVCGWISLNPGYDNYNHGHFLVSEYGSERLRLIGLGYNTWYGPYTIAYTSDIPTKVSQLTNDVGYVTTDTTYSTATSSTLGLVKIGYAANGKNYPVQLSNGQMYVNVPWTDTDTNTWRPITDSYSGTDSNTSLSQKGGNDIYNALINGYASSAGSSTYSNTLEVQDVRGSDIIPSKFDSHRITGWFNESTGLLSGNWCSGITVKGWHDGYSSWQLAGYSSTSFGSHGLFFREAASDSGWRDWIQVITSDNISSQTVAIANLARTLSQDGTIKLYVHNSNELNFGGTNASTTIYFGYRAADSRAIPTSFVFGESTGSATLTANGFIKKDSSDANVLLGGGGHKALSQFVQTSGDQSISGTKTFSGTIKANRAESITGFFQTSDIRYKNIIEYHYSLSNKIAQLPIIKYKWTDRNDDSIRIGSSAQSVMSIIPELVSYDNNTDFYSLDYATLGAIAGISACKEVEMLKQKIKELEQEIIILKSKYNG